MPPNPGAILPQNQQTRHTRLTPIKRLVHGRFYLFLATSLTRSISTSHSIRTTLAQGSSSLPNFIKPHLIQVLPFNQIKNNKFTYPQLQQQSQQTHGSHQTAPMSSFPTAVTPQQHARQISQGAGGQMPFSSPMTPPLQHQTLPNTTRASKIHRCSQTCSVWKVPDRAVPDIPNPSSPISRPTYRLSIRFPPFDQGNSPNNAALNQPPALSMGSLLNGVTHEKLISAIGECNAQGGCLEWTAWFSWKRNRLVQAVHHMRYFWWFRSRHG
ncbi:hypothetical protein PGT21_000152 [Puccinia graminis f. sp. tritici]|uniref:Uncharacterized protein n=1 Tax=Puccinia graminis f. sp. tritici TaxID=56615 RepID=A0A5B0MQC8_PUCGR|nr:hypothetical protein PGT21_000152 [Puccinia graminis f. sp. tritici]